MSTQGSKIISGIQDIRYNQWIEYNSLRPPSPQQETILREQTYHFKWVSKL